MNLVVVSVEFGDKKILASLSSDPGLLVSCGDKFSDPSFQSSEPSLQSSEPCLKFSDPCLQFSDPCPELSPSLCPGTFYEERLYDYCWV